MNERNHSEIDQLLDDIIFGRSSEENLHEYQQSKSREEQLNELILHQTAASSVQRHAIMQQVAAVHKEFLQNRTSKGAKPVTPVYALPAKKSKLNYIGLAASILGAIAVMVFLYATVATTPEKLFSSEYQAYHFNVDRSSNAPSGQSVIAAYQQGSYDAAIREYKGHPTAPVNENMAAAFSYMQLKQYAPAATILEDVIRKNVINGNHTYQDEAEYYLALCLLQLNQVEKSYKLFDKIYTDNEHTYNGRIDKWFMTRLSWLK